MSGPQQGYAALQWMPLVLPAHARRYTVSEPAAAAALRDAGAELVEDGADVEISESHRVSGEANVAVVTIDAPPDDGSAPRVVRAARRTVLWTRARTRAARAARSLRGQGYRVELLRWDHLQRVSLERPGEHDRRLSERLPGRAVVTGRRGDAGPTMLEDAMAAAEGLLGEPFEAREASTRAGFVLVLGGSSVLRVTVGPSRSHLQAHVRAVESLRELAPPPEISSRIPDPVGGGRAGLADWILEQRLPGTALTRGSLSDRVFDECTAFLATLFTIPRSEQDSVSLETVAESVARFSRPPNAPALRELARRIDDDLAGVRRGFGHGDFFSGNLLVRDGRLSGVLDWDAGGRGRLPLVDLMHFRLHLDHAPTDTDWGPALLRHLVPWARGGGDRIAEDYLERVGVEAEPRLLRALVISYWLERTAYQLETHLIRRHQPRWLARNVDLVIERLTGDSTPSRARQALAR